jgi:uncharacterized lipoprotein YmbA
VVTLGGCSFLKPKGDPTQFYVLRSQPGNPSTQIAKGQTNLAIRIGPWRFPGYLSSTPIIVADGTNRVQRLDFHQWAEPLDKGVSRVLAENLSASLSTPRVAIYPDDTSKQDGYEVIYAVYQFEGTEGGNVVLEVYWEVRVQISKVVVAEKRTRYVIPPSGAQEDVTGYVAQMSAALDEWSQDIAGVIPIPR